MNLVPCNAARYFDRMLPIPSISGDCQRALPRRSFLQAGALGLGGLTLAELLKLRAEGAGGTAGKPKDTAVILFWCSGGPGHMETWDPKPQAPVEYRGPLRAIDTSV